MTQLKNIIAAILGVSLMGLLVNCRSPDEGSDISAITFISDGSARAFSLLPVRNWTAANLGSSQDPGEKQARAMATSRLFALVECVDSVTERGQQLPAEDLMRALEMRGMIDDLYVSDRRILLTSLKDPQLIEYGTKRTKTMALPCRIVGSRLLSWQVLRDLQVRVIGLPRSESAAARFRDDVYSPSQTLHLALRGSWSQKAELDFMPRMPAFMSMVREQAGREPA